MKETKEEHTSLTDRADTDPRLVQWVILHPEDYRYVKAGLFIREEESVNFRDEETEERMTANVTDNNIQFKGEYDHSSMCVCKRIQKEHRTYMSILRQNNTSTGKLLCICRVRYLLQLPQNAAMMPVKLQKD
jgi:hypothetical protein